MKSEKQIEKSACHWARNNGWYTRKFSSPAHRGVPDRIFIKDGRVVFVEFKTATGQCTALQCMEIDTIREHSGEVYICRSLDDIKDVLYEG